MLAVLITVVAGGFMYLQTNETIRALKQMGAPVRMLDGALPLAYDFYIKAAFMVTMTVGAAVIARDAETGAFTFYFARPVRPRDYVLGKLTGQLVLMATIFLVGPLALVAFRIGLSETTREALDQVVLLPKVLVVGGLATLAYASLPLAVSALAGRRTVALGLWAAYYIVGVSTIATIGAFTWEPLTAIDPATSVDAIAFDLFDIHITKSKVPPMWAAVVSLLAQSAGAIAILWRQVGRIAEGSVGGSS
jgi:ABC-type transport system involved in multi-copper enzyme maturation permease subunit